MQKLIYTYLVAAVLILTTITTVKSQVIWHGDPDKGIRDVFYRFDITGYTSGDFCLDAVNADPSATTAIDSVHGKHWQIHKPVNRKRAEFARTNGFIPQEDGEYYFGWRWKISSKPSLNKGLAVFQCKTEEGANKPSTQNYPFTLEYDGTNLSLACFGPGYPDWSVGSSITNRKTTIWRKAVPQDKWVTFAFHVKFSRSETVGFIEFWYNGEKQTLTNSNYKEYQVILADDNTRAYHKTNDGNQVYFKWGSYGINACEFEITTKYDEMRVGSSYEDVKLEADCLTTTIEPFLKINNGDWINSSSGIVNTGDLVILGPTPSTGGTWNWSGPGTSGTSREQTFYANATGTATATYTNTCGTQSTQTFNLTVFPTGVQKISHSNWTLVSADSEADGNKAILAFDDNTNTFWHTPWGSAETNFPHEIIIKLGALYQLSGFSYLPRQDNSVNGTISEYKISTSIDGLNWEPVNAGKWTNSKNEKVVQFDNKSGEYVKLTALSEVNGNAWASAAEINLYGTKASPTSSSAIFDTSSANPVVIFPNPANSEFQIFVKEKENAKVNVHDMTGRLLAVHKTENHYLYLRKNAVFKSGIYFIQVIGNNEKPYLQKLTIK